MLKQILIFLVLNFSALAIGGIFTGSGVTSEWYHNLDKAPWTPPGWVFGFAWTTIMICFTLFMAYAWKSISNKKFLVGLFAIQWILNVLWNPMFFYFHNILVGLIIILLLSILIAYFFFGFMPQLKLKSLFVLPYFIWLLIATSLNAYIFFMN